MTKQEKIKVRCGYGAARSCSILKANLRECRDEQHCEALEIIEGNKTERHEQGDALVKHGKPISYHYGVSPKCRYCERISMYRTWECKYPGRRDTHEYTECCMELDFKVCPLNTERKPEEKERGNHE